MLLMNVTENIKYIGVNDHISDMFEGQFKIPNGISYNSYIILDEKVAVFERGTVKAVGPGETVVYAEYGDQKVSCIIRCNWEPEETQEPTEPTEPTEPEIEPGIYVMHINGDLPSEIYGADVSLGVGESFTLTVVSPSGKTINVDWTADEDGVVSIDGNTITGAGSGMVYVSAVYNDQTFVCIVRVS